MTGRNGPPDKLGVLSENFIGVVFIMQPRLGQSVIIEIVRRRQELFGTIVQRLNLKHELHHTVPKLCILGFESLK